MKICKKCKQEKELQEFHRNKLVQDGRASWCKLCTKEAVKVQRNKDPLYSTWYSMKQRCFNKRDTGYKYYGGRGIIVCERWMKYKNFIEDMLSNYKEGLTLDRRDVDGDYCKENCRWITQGEQNRNRRSTIFIKYQGKVLALSEWCATIGISYRTALQRYRNGWSPEKILSKYKHSWKGKPLK